MADYHAILADTEKKLFAIINDEEGWQKCQNVSKVKITSKKSTYFPGNMFRAEVDVDADYQKVAKTWTPKPKGRRQDWDKGVTSLDCIEEIDEQCMIVRTVTPSAAMGLIASREFIDLMMLKFSDDGVTAMTVAQSVPHKDFPEQKDAVRGNNFPCGVVFRKTGFGKTHVTYIGHTSLGGDLPISLIEAAMPSSIHTMLDTLRKVATQN